MIGILITVLIAVLIIEKKHYSYWLNPLSSFLGLWIIAFILFLGSDYINHDLSVFSFSVCIIGIVSFVLGVFLSRKLETKRIKTSTYSSGGEKELVIIVNIGFYLSVVLFLANLLFVHSKVGIKTYFSQMLRYGENYFAGKGFLSFIYNILLYLKRTLIVFSSISVYSLIVAKKEKRKAILTIFISFVLSIAYARTLSLYFIIIDLLSFYFCFFCKLKKKIRIRFLVPLTSLAFLFVFFFISSQERLNKTFEINGRFLGIDLPNSVITLISYFMGTIKSSDVYLVSTSNSFPLIATFRYFYDLFQITNTTKVFAQSFVFIPFEYNTAYFQYYLYFEGGYIWLFIASVIWGFISESVYNRMSINPDCFNIASVSIVFLGIIMSTRSYMIMYLEYLIPIGTIVVLKLFFGQYRVKLKSKKSRVLI